MQMNKNPFTCCSSAVTARAASRFLASSNRPVGPIFLLMSSCPYGQSQASSGCPVAQDKLNPLNNIPYDLSPKSASVEEVEEDPGGLSTTRSTSSIPRAIADESDQAKKEHWVYPSPRMFYNALQRKGMLAPVSTIPTVVAIHNFLNERVWQEIVSKWEVLHKSECVTGPKLKRFAGRPESLSPKAKIVGLLGGARPFDRHDWVIDRCGKEVWSHSLTV